VKEDAAETGFQNGSGQIDGEKLYELVEIALPRVLMVLGTTSSDAVLLF